MKNYLIGGVIGLLFMAGGFWFGLRLAPKPPAKKVAATTKAPAPTPEAISLETLRKTTEGMMDINQALQAREREVAAREKRVHEEEDEIAAERSALDRSHDKFKELYAEFQQRLELVDNNEQDQLQRQVTIYNSMDPTQSVDLIRAMDDPTVIKLFSIMDVKPLTKTVSAWKAKYPTDGPRILAMLNGMGRVVPKDKMIMPDGASASNAGTDSAAPAADNSAPASADPNATSTTDAPAPAAAPDNSTDNTTVKSDPLAPPSDAPAPAATSDAPAAPANDSSAPADTHSAAATTPPADASTDGVATAKNN